MRKDKNPIYGSEKKKFFEKRWVVELVASGPTALGAAVGAFAAQEKSPDLALLLLASLFWLIFAQSLKVWNAHRQDEKDEELRNHDGLTAAMHVLHETVTSSLIRSNSDDPDVRATFHRVVSPLNDPQEIEQIIPYVGGDNDGQGRAFPVRSGITGCAVRDGTKAYVMDRQSDSDDEYRKELVSEWHYTPADAKKATMDRFSAIAVPVSDRTGQRVLGVIYLDAKRKGCFSSPEMIQLVVDACGGVSKYVGVRYD